MFFRPPLLLDDHKQFWMLQESLIKRSQSLTNPIRTEKSISVITDSEFTQPSYATIPGSMRKISGWSSRVETEMFDEYFYRKHRCVAWSNPGFHEKKS